MKLGGIGSYIQPIEPLLQQEKIAPKGLEKTEKPSEFGEMLKSAIKEVEGLQDQAANQIEGLTLGKEGVTTHGAMIALEHADVAFQLMSTIRSKIIRAYEEVIRTQI